MIRVNLVDTPTIKVSAGKNIIVRIFGQSLKVLLEHINIIINDTVLNRLMRDLDRETQKGMTSSATVGFGASAGYFIIRGSVIIKILKQQIERKLVDIKLEKRKSIPDKSVIKSIQYAIDSLNDYIIYFNLKTDKYFIVNGQHRFDSIKKDFNGDLDTDSSSSKKKKNANLQSKDSFRYSDLEIKIGEEIFTENVNSLQEVKTKLLSAIDGLRYEWAKDLSKSLREEIYNQYLERCQVFIYEITDAVSFPDVMTFVKQSNQSTEWDDFLFNSIQSMSAYTRWFRKNCISEKTNELSDYEKMFYGKGSPHKKGMAKGTFARSGGGWQYFIGNLMVNCYVTPEYSLPLFRVSNKKEIETVLFDDGSPFLPEWGESLLTDITKISSCITKLSEKPNSKIFYETYHLASFLIYCIYAYNYYKKFYTFTNGKDRYKLNIQDDNLYQFIEDICLISFTKSQIATDENTNFWKTPEGLDKIEEWKISNALVNPKLVHPIKAKDLKDVFQNEWDDIKQKCEENETKDITKSFGRHIVGDLISWAKDHSCVVNTFNQHIHAAFTEVMVECKEPKKPFSKIGFVSVSELPKASELVTSNYDDLYEYLNSTEETDKAHDVARANGGSSSISNINLGNRKKNRRQKNVV